MRRLRIWAVMTLAMFTVFTTVASAHELNMTGVKVKLGKNDVVVSVIAHLHQLTGDDIAAEIARRLKLRLNDKLFAPSDVQLTRDEANGIVIWQATQPAAATTVALDAPVFPENTSQSTVLTVLKDRQVLDEAILDAAHPTAIIGKNVAVTTAPPISTAANPSSTAPSSSAARSYTVIRQYLYQGVVHIFLGPDHILFLLSLLLLGGTWQQLLKIATAFTLAHSVTLSLAATGLFSLPPRFVEPVIALSIVAVAFTNFRAPRPRPESKPRRDIRPWLALGFGLIHGFGFAGALAELGLPRESLGWALVAFNAGVELGQAALVLLFAPVLAAIIKFRPRLQLPVVHYGSATVAAVGAFWFFQRVFIT